MRVLGIGYCTADILLGVDGNITENRKIRASSLSTQGGGPVGTATTALALWGVKTSFAGVIGDDLAGQFIRDNFIEHNVDVSALRVFPGAQSSLSVCVTHGEGMRTIYYNKGSAPGLTVEDIAGIDVSGFDAVEVDGHHSAAQIHAARKCNEHGVPVILDAGSLRDEILPLLDLCGHIVASRDFAEAFDPGGDWERTCRKLHGGSVSVVVITLGEEGSVGFDGKNDFQREALKIDVIDTIGAGDVYHAGYIYALLRGWSLEERMKFATVCAGLKCRGRGGQKPIPSIEEAMKVYETL